MNSVDDETRFHDDDLPNSIPNTDGPIGVEHVNWLIRVCDIVQEKPIYSLKQCSSSLFVLLFQRLLQSSIPDLEFEPNTQEKKLWNMKRVLDELSLVFQTDLSYISASEIVNCSEEHVARLIRVFLSVAIHLMQRHQQMQSSPHGVVGEPSGSDWEFRWPHTSDHLLSAPPPMTAHPPPRMFYRTANHHHEVDDSVVTNDGDGEAIDLQHWQEPVVLREDMLRHYRRRHTPQKVYSPEGDAAPNNDSHEQEADLNNVHPNKSSTSSSNRPIHKESESRKQQQQGESSNLNTSANAAAGGAVKDRSEEASDDVSNADSAVFTNALVQDWKENLVPPARRREGSCVDPLSIAEVRQRMHKLEQSLGSRARSVLRPQGHDSRQHAAQVALDRNIHRDCLTMLGNQRRDEKIIELRNRRLNDELQSVIKRRVVQETSALQLQLLHDTRESFKQDAEKRCELKRKIRDEDTRARKAFEAMVASECLHLRLHSTMLSEETHRFLEKQRSALREAKRVANEKKKKYSSEVDAQLEAYRRQMFGWCSPDIAGIAVR